MTTQKEPSESVQSLLLYTPFLTEQEKIDLACGLATQIDTGKMGLVSKFWQKTRASRLKEAARVAGACATPIPRPGTQGMSAWQTPLIFRGDLIPKNGILFLDVEKVTMVKLAGEEKHRMVAATVAIVDVNGTIVLWAFIRHDIRHICQYFTQITNLERGSLEEGIPMYTLYELLSWCLEGNTLVGYDVGPDLHSMGYTHDKIEDLKDFYKDDEGKAIGVKTLAHILLKGKEIQKGHHSAITDARIHLALYQERQKEKYKGAKVFGIPVQRMPKESFMKGDYCRCPK
jgi:hypothetical protein